TSLNGVWDTVGPQIHDLVEKRTACYSIDPARLPHSKREGEEDILSLVIVWVGVHTASTTAETAYEVSQDILQLLAKNGVQDFQKE
ncbi:hypothetical protein J3R30DRAFT_3372939, partial [Lentinula aciculospora]